MIRKKLSKYFRIQVLWGVYKKWFIEGADSFDINEDNVCIHLTDYKLLPYKVLKKKLHNEISKLRWVHLFFYKIGAGYASGFIIIDKKLYKLSYAWGGVSSKENGHHRECYTVKLKRDNCDSNICTFIRKVNHIENYQVWNKSLLVIYFPSIKRIRPYNI